MFFLLPLLLITLSNRIFAGYHGFTTYSCVLRLGPTANRLAQRRCALRHTFIISNFPQNDKLHSHAYTFISYRILPIYPFSQIKKKRLYSTFCRNLTSMDFHLARKLERKTEATHWAKMRNAENHTQQFFCGNVVSVKVFCVHIFVYICLRVYELCKMEYISPRIYEATERDRERERRSGSTALMLFDIFLKHFVFTET